MSQIKKKSKHKPNFIIKTDYSIAEVAEKLRQLAQGRSTQNRMLIRIFAQEDNPKDSFLFEIKAEGIVISKRKEYYFIKATMNGIVFVDEDGMVILKGLIRIPSFRRQMRIVIRLISVLMLILLAFTTYLTRPEFFIGSLFLACLFLIFYFTVFIKHEQLDHDRDYIIRRVEEKLSTGGNILS